MGWDCPKRVRSLCWMLSQGERTEVDTHCSLSLWGLRTRTPQNTVRERERRKHSASRQRKASPQVFPPFLANTTPPPWGEYLLHQQQQKESCSALHYNAYMAPSTSKQLIPFDRLARINMCVYHNHHHYKDPFFLALVWTWLSFVAIIL
jgi:hypothetical protein